MKCSAELNTAEAFHVREEGFRLCQFPGMSLLEEEESLFCLIGCFTLLKIGGRLKEGGVSWMTGPVSSQTFLTDTSTQTLVSDSPWSQQSPSLHSNKAHGSTGDIQTSVLSPGSRKCHTDGFLGSWRNALVKF